MAQVIRFPKYPPSQWALRRKIERMLGLLGWDMARCMKGFSADGPERWQRMNDGELGMMLEYVQEEYMMLLARAQKPALAAKAKAPAKPKRPARIFAFDTTPEIEERQKALRAAKPKKAKAPKASKQSASTPAASPAPAKPDGKARLIRKVKMLQRDCEKALPEFTDYTYRAILQERYDAESSKELNQLQLMSLLLYMQGLLNGQGGAVKASYDAPALLREDKSGLGRTEQMAKIQALLAEKGKAEGKYIRWSYALGILKRQTGGVVTEWEHAMPVQLAAVAAALYKDAVRKGRHVR